jgi:intraflagellar transport protein 52
MFLACSYDWHGVIKSRSQFSMPPLRKTITIVTRGDILHQDKLHRHLQSDHNAIILDSNDLCFSDSDMKECDLVILSISGNEDLRMDELDAMNSYLKQGKSIALFVSSSITCASVTGQRILNEFLSGFGIRIEEDGVVRTVYSKYLHPKLALINDGVLHPNLVPEHLRPNDESAGIKDYNHESLNGGIDAEVGFVYPHGCTLSVKAPSWPILSSGSLSFPLKRPICAIWEDLSKSKADSSQMRGRLLTIGSIEMFSDEFLEKEFNSHLLDKFIQFLLHQDEINSLSRSTMNSNGMLEDARPVPDIEALAERVKCCLQEHRPLPQDLNELYCRKPLTFDTSMIPKVMRLYDELNVKYEPLSLIKPEFERPYPSLEPAVFQPRMMDLAPPALEQFDLDEEFAEPAVRLARLTNKCSNGVCDEDELEYFVQEAGCITGLVGQDDGDMNGKEVLHKLFLQVCVEFSICNIAALHLLQFTSF